MYDGCGVCVSRVDEGCGGECEGYGVCESCV